MNKGNSLFENLLHKINIKNIKKDNLIILFLLGVLLLIIFIPAKSKNENEKVQDAKVNKSVTASEIAKGDTTEDSYEEKLEKRLESVLRQVEHVGDVKVMITLKSSEERIVEKDIPTDRSSIVEADSEGGSRTTTESSSTEETIYATGENGETSPYVVKELEPEIEGVLIIASGADNPQVVQDITDAVHALFSVEVHKIKVMKMNK